MTRLGGRQAAAPVASAPRTVPRGTGTVAFRLGAVSVALAGRPDLLAPLARELDTAIAPPSAAPADLRLVFDRVTGEPPVAGAHRSRFPFTHVAGVSAGRLVYELRPRVGPPLYRVSLRASFDRTGPWEATVRLPAPSRRVRRLLDPPTRALSRDCSSFAALVAKNVLDEIIDPLLWLRLLPAGGVLAHASAVVTHDDRGVLLLGAGGAGKTQTMLHLVARGGCRFLSDDRTALLDGRLHRHPKLLRLSGYHVTSLAPVERSLLAGRSGTDAAWWRARKGALGVGRVGRRTRPEAVLGPSRVAGAAPLGDAFLMEAVPAGAALTVSAVTADELSRRAASMVCNQFWDVLRYFSLLSAAGGAAVPSVGDLHARTAAVFADNLAAVSLYRVGVPPDAAWARVADAVLAHTG